MAESMRWYLAGFLAGFVVSSGSFAGPPCNDGPLVAHQRILPGETPREVAAGDLNGDGVEDLVVVNSTSDDLSVFLGNENGTFAPASSFPVGDGPFSLAIRDVNSDGVLDVVVPLANDNTVRVMIGDGIGGFILGQLLTVGLEPKAVALGDIDGDSIEDIAVANVDSDDVSILLGQGGGLFGVATSLAVGDAPRGIALADLDGDTQLDIVTANEIAGTVSVLLGIGDGTFASATSVATGAGCGSVVASDFDSDGDVDLATSNGVGGNLSILLNNSDGTFAPAASIAIGPAPRVVTSCDLDGDDVSDLAVTFHAVGRVATLYGNGDGTFTVGPILFVDQTPQGIACADFNGDALTDVCVTNTVRSSVSVIFGRGDRAFDTGVRLSITPNPFEAAFGDFNGDGVQDIVVAVRDTNDLAVRLGNGDGSFQPVQRYGVGTGANGLAVADLNGDSVLDLVSANVTGDNVSILLGLNDGTFGAANTFFSGNGTWSVVARDFNGDNVPDIASTNFNASTIGLRFGNGNGTFGGLQTLTSGQTPFQIISEDFNNDGAFDLAYAVGGANAVEIRLGNGNGTFQSALPSSTGDRPESLAASDLDGDGNADLVVTNNDDDDVSVLLGNGNGTFQAPMRFGVGGRPDWVAIDDLNGDAIPDLVVANDRTDDLSVLFGIGDGSFEPERRHAARDGAHRVALADLDNDGSTDLAIVNREDASVSILLSTALATVYWNGGASQLFSNGGNWDGGVAPSLLGPNTPVFDTTVSDFDTVESVVLNQIGMVRSMFQANNEVQLNLNGNDFFVAGDATALAPFGLELGVEQCDGGSPLPPIAPVFRLDNTNLLDAAFVTPSVTIGRDGAATLEIDGDNGRATLNIQNRLTVGGRGEGTLRLRTAESQIEYGALADESDAFVIGDGADGTVSVENASRVSPLGAAPLLLGVEPGVTGVLDIVGVGFGGASDSRFGHLGDSIVVGDGGRGEVRIANGGRLQTQALDIVFARGAGSSASLLISGEDSLWNDPLGEITFGEGDSVTITVEDGGVLDVAGGIVVSTNGTLAGDGTVSEIVNFGDVVVGGRGEERGVLPSTLTIDGDFDQFDDPLDPELSGRIFVDLFDAGATLNSDQLIVNGEAQLAGGLIFESGAPVDPSGAAPLDVLVADSIMRRFDVAFFPAVMPGVGGEGRFLRVNYNSPLLGGGTVSISVDTLAGAISTDPAETFNVTGQPMAAAVGDLNNDGLIDLALAVPHPTEPLTSQGAVFVLFNAGSSGGAWNGFAGSAQVTVGVDPSGVALGDADLDGGLDIAVTNRADGTAMVLTNDGMGLPGSIAMAQMFDVGDEPSSVAFGDLDNDAWADLAVANFGSNNVTIVRNLQGVGGGWMGVGSPQTFPAGQGPVDVVFGDLDEDKWDDVVVASANSGTVTYLDNTFPPGTFDPPLVLGSDMGSADLACEDLDGAGGADLIIANPASGTVSIILNNGDSTFEPVVNLPIAGGPRSVAAVDLDDDLDADLVVIADDGVGSNAVRVLRNDLTSGQLTFSPDADIDAGGVPLFVLAGDVDNDGQGDLVTVNATGSPLASSSGPVMPISVVRQASSVCTGDCDNSGAVDFNDLVAMLFEFGEGTPACDADASGTVDFNDLVAALFLFGPCPS